MANAKKADPLIMPGETKARLENLQGDIDRARRGVEVLKSLGMDTKAIEERLDWSENVKKTLLKEFGG